MGFMERLHSDACPFKNHHRIAQHRLAKDLVIGVEPLIATGKLAKESGIK